MTDDMWLFEEEAYEGGETAVCGVDEAGRGPLAGPVYAAAVILPRGLLIPGLDDSKKLTAKKRDELFDIIREKAVAYGIASATEKEIDEKNILNATYLAMNRAMKAMGAPFSLALIDGNRSEGITYPCRCIIGGDGKSESIAAASVLAKVSRDRYMAELEKKYPGYGFERHKGYGTKAHYAALRELGPSEAHRLTFLKKMH
ncbi:MAG: ribonuclease HII [Oscillospiraceae bacterium]|nr:ribonuclease HII [Oscillospiraceae bacterium]